MLEDIIIKKLDVIFIVNKRTYYNEFLKKYIDNNIKRLCYNSLPTIIDDIFKNVNNNNLNLKDKISSINNFSIPINIDLNKINFNKDFDIFENEFKKVLNLQLSNYIREIFDLNYNKNNVFVNKTNVGNKNSINNIDYDIDEKNIKKNNIIKLITNIKNENDIKLIYKLVNINKLYEKILKNDNVLKEFWVEISKNDISLDFILDNITNVQSVKTLNILYNTNVNSIDNLKKEIYEYKNYLFLDNIKINQIDRIIKRELLKNYAFRNFNLYEFSTIIINKMLKINNKTVYDFVDEVVKKKIVFDKKNSIINNIILDYINEIY